MPVKKTTRRPTKKKVQPVDQVTVRANKLTVAIICAAFVVVGIFLVYKSFAAVILSN